MGVWEYGSEDFVNILYHIHAFSIYIPDIFLVTLSFGQKKAALVVGTAFYYFITSEKFIQLLFQF
jgi:hypothetical protein